MSWGLVWCASRKVLIEPDFDDEPELDAGPGARPAVRIFKELLLNDETVDDFGDYRGATFKGNVVLRDVRFPKGFSFSGATFHGKVRFLGVTNGRTGGSVAEFAGAKFHQSAHFNRRSALYRADFQGAYFGDVAKFQGCRLYAAASFNKALFSGPANFKGATFNGSGTFLGARFESSADFEEVIFRYQLSHARFIATHFSSAANFNGARFCGTVDFTEAVFFQGTNFHAARFDLRQKHAWSSGISSPRELWAAGLARALR